MLQPAESKYVTLAHDDAVTVNDGGTSITTVTLDGDYPVVRVGVLDLDAEPSTSPIPCQVDPGDDPPVVAFGGGGGSFVGMVGSRTMLFRPNDPLREVASPRSGMSAVAFGPHAPPEFMPATLILVVEGYTGTP